MTINSTWILEEWFWIIIKASYMITSTRIKLRDQKKGFMRSRFKSTLLRAGLNSGRAPLRRRESHKIEVRDDKLSQTVFQQYGPHTGSLYTVKFWQSTVVWLFHNVQYTRKIENSTKEASLKSWREIYNVNPRSFICQRSLEDCEEKNERVRN